MTRQPYHAQPEADLYAIIEQAQADRAAHISQSFRRLGKLLRR